MVNLRFVVISLLLFSTLSFQAHSESLRVAVAANFAKPVELLLTQFKKIHPFTPQITVASTGVLYQQIRHGAPFDIFFAADLRRPELLEQQHLIFEKYRKTYAIGQIALWSAISNKPITMADLNDYNGRIAIAAPHIAPYGLAAKEALISANLWRKFDNKLIVGNNINQTYQQLVTGAVKYGFVSYSQLLNSKRGNGVLIDHNMHHELEQQMVVLRNAKNIELATLFFEFVLTNQGQQIINSQGYLPAITIPDQKIEVSDDNVSNVKPLKEN